MCSATGYPVAERPAYTRGENRFSTIVPSLVVTGCSSINSRREFITLVGGAVAWPLAARAQDAGRVARVGMLGPDPQNPVTGPGYQIFISELHKLGFTQGHSCR